MNWVRNPQNPFRSFIVKASAGSGKTYQLSRRFIYLTARGSAPETILTITFTRKAAAEMKERILQLAKELKSGGPFLKEFEKVRADVAQTHSFRTAEQTSDIIFESAGKLQITTIDSCFYDWFLRYYFDPELKADREYTLPRKQDMEQCREAAWQRVCSSLSKYDDGEPTDYLHSLLQTEGALNLKTRLMELNRHHSYLWLFSKLQNMDLPILGFELPDASDDPTDVLRSIESPLRIILAELSDKIREKVELCLDLKDFDALVESGLFKKDDYSLSGTYLRGAKKERLASEVERVEYQVKTYFDRKRLILLNASAAVYKELYARYETELRNQKNRQAFIEFDDLAKACFQLMYDDSFLGARYFIQKQIRHLLIDEFQDTSHLQWNIFKGLTQEITAGSGLEDERDVGAGTVFIVGDTKQSIYGFREADPKILEHLEGELVSEDIDVIELNHSYRSSPTILQFVNRYFENRIESFPEHSAASAGGKPLTARESSVTILEAVEKDEDSEAKAISSVISSLIKRRLRCLIREKEEYRNPDYRDIAILYRKSTNIGEIIEALHEASIPYIVEKESKLELSQIWRDFKELLNFLAFPADNVALLSILKSPLFGFSDQNVMAMLRSLKSEQRNCLDWLSATDEPSLQFLKSAVTCTPKNWYVQLLKLYNQPEVKSRYLSGLGQTATVVQQSEFDGVLNFIVKRASDKSAVSPFHLKIELEKTFEDESSDFEFPVSANAVRIMSIHKSKGLEFPVVFMCDTAGKWEKKDPYWCKGRTSDGYSGLFMVGTSKEQPQGVAEFDRILERAAVELEEETERLVYVALTRAEQHLFITGTDPSREKPEESVHAKCKLALQSAFSQHESIEIDGFKALRFQCKDPDLIMSNMPVASRQPGRPPTLKAQPAGLFREFKTLAQRKTLARSQSKNISELEIEKRRLEGLFIHKLLEIDCQDDSQLGSVWRDILQMNSEDPASWFEHDLSSAHGHFTSFRESELWRSIKAGAKRMRHELALCQLNGSQFNRGICDLVVWDRSDVMWIYDFKTSPDMDETVALSYREQLQEYKAALQTIYPEQEIRCAVLSTAKCAAFHL